MVVSADQVEAVCEEDERLETVEGAVVSIVTFGVAALNVIHAEHAEPSSHALTCHLYPVASESPVTFVESVKAVDE